MMMMCRDGWVPPDENCDAEMEESLEGSPGAKQPDACEAEMAVVYKGVICVEEDDVS